MDFVNYFAVLLGLLVHARESLADSYCYYDDGSYICYHYYYSSLSSGAYAGIIVACLIILIIKISLIIVCCIRRRNRYAQRGTVIMAAHPPMGVSTVNSTVVGYGAGPGSATGPYNQYGVPPPNYSSTTKQGQHNYGYQQN